MGRSERKAVWLGLKYALADGVVNMGKLVAAKQRLGFSRHLGTVMKCIIIR